MRAQLWPLAFFKEGQFFYKKIASIPRRLGMVCVFVRTVAVRGWPQSVTGGDGSGYGLAWPIIQMSHSLLSEDVKPVQLWHLAKITLFMWVV
jgi:hypothetical protein